MLLLYFFFFLILTQTFLSQFYVSLCPVQPAHETVLTAWRVRPLCPFSVFFSFNSSVSVSSTFCKCLMKVICNSCPCLNLRLSIALSWLDHLSDSTQPFLHRQPCSTVIRSLATSLIVNPIISLLNCLLIITTGSPALQKLNIARHKCCIHITTSGFSLLCVCSVTHAVPL